MTAYNDWLASNGLESSTLGHEEHQILYRHYTAKESIDRKTLDAEVKAWYDRHDANEKYREDLWWALQTRVLTPEEMEKVRQYGDSLNVADREFYNSKEKKLELMTALFNQARLQLIAAGKGDLFQTTKGG